MPYSVNYTKKTKNSKLNKLYGKKAICFTDKELSLISYIEHKRLYVHVLNLKTYSEATFKSDQIFTMPFPPKAQIILPRLTSQ
jgi:hypothetical protein